MFDKNSVYAFSTAILFASLGIFAKYIYGYNFMDAYIMFFYSAFFSTVLLFFVLLTKYKNFSFLKNIDKKSMYMAVFNGGLFALFLTNLASLKSLEYIDAGIQKVLVFLSPLFILPINSLFFGKKLNKRDVVSIVIMILGLVLIVGKLGTSKNITIGLIIALFGSFFNAIYSILEENAKTVIPDQLVYWFYAFFASSIYSVIFLLFDGDISNVMSIFGSLNLILLIISSSILCFTLPYICFLKSIEKIGAVKTGIILSLSPVATILLSICILHEHFTISQVLGIVLVVTSIIFSSLKDK